MSLESCRVWMSALAACLVLGAVGCSRGGEDDIVGEALRQASENAKTQVRNNLQSRLQEGVQGGIDTMNKKVDSFTDKGKKKPAGTAETADPADLAQ